MPAPPLVVTPLAARRFARAAVGLDTPHPSIGAALDYHGFIQIDPINVCGRMHDLILRNRVADYREGDLMRFLHGAPDDQPDADQTPTFTNSKPSVLPTPRGQTPNPKLKTQNSKPPAQRTAFEHHAPDTGNLAAFPLDAWPHLQSAMLARQRRSSAWSGRLTPRERELAPTLLAEIAARGPLGSEDFADPRRAHRVVWGAASLVKSTLQKLFFHGRLLIAQRANNRRRYDLPERVLPAEILARPAASASDTARWLVALKLRQRRLVTLRRHDLTLVEDVVQPLTVEGCPRLYCLQTDAPLLESCASECRSLLAGDPERAPTSNRLQAGSYKGQPQPQHASLRLLAPLDPLIYDRRLTAALWDFDYTWEVYTPPAKRVRGYYALPVLAGTELVGHVDPKADRAARRLRVVSRRIRRGHRVSEGVREFAGWLGLR